jgi:predicted HTH transcriptional regulator
VSGYASRIEIWNTGCLPDELKIADLKRVSPATQA